MPIATEPSKNIGSLDPRRRADGAFGEPNRVFLLAAERPPGAHTATIHPRGRGHGHSRRPASKKQQISSCL